FSEKKSTDLAKIKKREITQADIEEAEKHYITGLYYYQNGFLEEAVAEWETVLRINPRHDKTRTSLKKVKGELRKLRY
ncbi:tetratricopeptide repeat protein, partial [bacterium]|nr:tetratricopeptide repeat protein [bacterium]